MSQTTREIAEAKVCADILRIMAVYRRQVKSPDGIGTPGGLEHMGDVWSLLAKWEKSLLAASQVTKQSQDRDNE